MSSHEQLDVLGASGHPLGGPFPGLPGGFGEAAAGTVHRARVAAPHRPGPPAPARGPAVPGGSSALLADSFLMPRGTNTQGPPERRGRSRNPRGPRGAVSRKQQLVASSPRLRLVLLWL